MFCLPVLLGQYCLSLVPCVLLIYTEHEHRIERLGNESTIEVAFHLFSIFFLFPSLLSSIKNIGLVKNFRNFNYPFNQMVPYYRGQKA